VSLSSRREPWENASEIISSVPPRTTSASGARRRVEVLRREQLRGVLVAEADGLLVRDGLELVVGEAHGVLRPVEEDAREEADDEDEPDERRERERLAAGEVRQMLVLRVRQRAEEHLLDDAEHVDGREDDARRGAHGLDAAEDAEPLGDERARDDHELADEAVRTRHAHRRERDDDEDGRVERHHLREAAELVHHARVAAIVDRADEEEERAGRDAVVHHLEHGALHAGLRDREEAQHHVAEVRDRRVRDEALHVVLLPGHERAVDDAAEDRDAREVARVARGHPREEPHREP
jgi:hypothetical protein